MAKDIEQIAFDIIAEIDYDLWKEVKAEPFEDDLLERVKDILYDFQEEIIESTINQFGSS